MAAPVMSVVCQHRGTHDFAPSIHPDGGVACTAMTATDNVISPAPC